MFHRKTESLSSKPMVNSSILETISSWKGKTISYFNLKNTQLYQSLNDTVLEPLKKFQKENPKVFAIAFAALGLLGCYLTIDFAYLAFKRSIVSIVPLMVLSGYGSMAIFTWNKVADSWKLFFAPAKTANTQTI